MASTFPAVASKATLVGGTSAAIVTLRSIGKDGGSREAIETSNMDTTVNKTFDVADLADAGEFSYEGLYDGRDYDALLNAVAETWTLTFRTGASATTLAGSGFHTAAAVTGEHEGLWLVSGTIKLTAGMTLSNAPA